MSKRPFRIAVGALLIVAVVAATSLGPAWGGAGGAVVSAADGALAPPTLVTRPGTYSSDSTPTWTFTGEPNATFSCTLSKPHTGITPSNFIGDPPTELILDSGPCDSGTYTFDLGAYADGLYVLSVTQTLGGTTSPAHSDAETDVDRHEHADDRTHADQDAEAEEVASLMETAGRDLNAHVTIGRPLPLGPA